jgi:hypothetical protein
MLATTEDTDAILIMTANQLGLSRLEVEGMADIRLRAAGLLALAEAETRSERLRLAAGALAKQLRQFKPSSVRPRLAKRSPSLRVVL